MNLTIAEIAKAVKGEIMNDAGDAFLHVPRIKNIITDSRKVLPDSLFLARKGENADGHAFVLKAIGNGAAGAVVEKNSVKQFDLHTINAPIIAVDDTAQALLDAAKYYKSLYKNIDITVAVTGSVGKTTVKEFIYSVLGAKFKTQKSEGNLNTETGLPMTLFSLEEDTKAIVLEMGMSGFGEISRLSKTANPNTAVITTIGSSHISMLGSREGIKKAKFEILDGMDGINSNIILNADNEFLYCEKNKTGKKEYFFGIKNHEADFTAENIEFDYSKNISVFEVKKNKFIIPAAGIHNVYNALPAIITGKIYGLSDEEIQTGFNNFQNVKMRQNIYDFNGITIIDDCYNASLESVLAALEVLANIDGNRKIAVLSDILETGDFADEIHRKIGEAIAEKNIGAYLFGEKSKAAFDAVLNSGGGNRDAMYLPDKTDIINVTGGFEAKKGDVILFKASRGMAMETVLEDFKKIFAERNF